MTTQRTRPQRQTAPAPEPPAPRGLVFRCIVVAMLFIVMTFCFFALRTIVSIRQDIHMVCLNTLPEKASVAEGMCP